MLNNVVSTIGLLPILGFKGEFSVMGYKVPLHIHEQLGTEVGNRYKDFKF